MVFFVPRSATQFCIPDDWWTLCDCDMFQRKTDFYVYPRELDLHTDIVAIEEVEPPNRDAGTEPFKKHRLVPVLLGLQSQEGVVPPVEVLAQDGGRYRYRVRNGFHRFYASVALGFPKLPVITKLVISCIKY